jgi:hypothetical protein
LIGTTGVPSTLVVVPCDGAVAAALDGSVPAPAVASLEDGVVLAGLLVEVEDGVGVVVEERGGRGGACEREPVADAEPVAMLLPRLRGCDREMR